MKVRRVGPHSRPHRLAKVDHRTHAGRLFEAFRSTLLQHVGPSPTVTQLALIERCSWVHLRCALMDCELMDGSLSEQDSRQYLAWANTERRILGQLGLGTAPAPRRPIAEIFAEREAARNGAAA